MTISDEIAKDCPFSGGHYNVNVFTRDWDGCSRQWQQPCWLYSLMGHEGGLLYVGIAYDVNARWKQHATSKPWWSDVSEAVVEKHCCRRHARIAEAFTICDEDAVHNVQRPRHPHRYELRTWTHSYFLEDLTSGVPA